MNKAEKNKEQKKPAVDSDKQEHIHDRSAVITAAVIALLLVNTAVGSVSALNTVRQRTLAAQNNNDGVFETAVETPCEAAAPVIKIIETHDSPHVQISPETFDLPSTIDEPPPPPPPPETHIMKFPHITQDDKMPTGCEIVSSSMVMSYYGKKNITLPQILRNMERSTIRVDKKGRLYGMSPEKAFIGNPYELTGIGCFPPVVKEMFDNFRFDDIEAEITTGKTLNELSTEYTANDIPVLIWVTTFMCQTEKGDKWYIMDESGEITDEKFTWPLNEHCVVLIGYDKKYYYISDPLESASKVKYEKKVVEKRFKELGSRSVAVSEIN